VYIYVYHETVITLHENMFTVSCTLVSYNCWHIW